MKTERAIELLHRISDSQFDGPHGDERREALEMAVRALEGDGDTISRKMAIEAMGIINDSICEQQAVDALCELPSAQPERKTGKWINVNEGKWNTYEVLKCSVCGEMDNRMTRADNYCPNCGADMRGESDE